MKSTFLACIAATAYGITDELHQGFVPGRDPSMKDIAMDTIGAILGSGLAAVWARRWRGHATEGAEDGR